MEYVRPLRLLLGHRHPDHAVGRPVVQIPLPLKADQALNKGRATGVLPGHFVGEA